VDASLDKLVARGQMDQPSRNTAGNSLTVTTSYDDLSDAETIIEAVFEDLAVKREVAEKLGGVLSEMAIFASNSSSISIDRIADAYPRPEHVVGIHFFNPVPVLPLVEVVVGQRTSATTVERADALARRLGKTPIEVRDRPGFVVNRLLIPMINEAALLLGEGVADADAIDTAMKLGASHPMGPLALADLIGIDVCLAIMETLATDLDAARFDPAPLLRQMADEGRLGRKSGQGFFSYDR
jgi:3-hydroxybutyryl-CoA dehydrogenase